MDMDVSALNIQRTLVPRVDVEVERNKNYE